MKKDNGLPISNIGDSSLHASSSSFYLFNILEANSITKNLVSVAKFCIDNACFFEFHSNFGQGMDFVIIFP